MEPMEEVECLTVLDEGAERQGVLSFSRDGAAGPRSKLFFFQISSPFLYKNFGFDSCCVPKSHRSNISPRIK